MQVHNPATINTSTNMVGTGDLAREVYGILGIPVDATDMTAVLRRIETAAADRLPCLISTANLNFLVTSGIDAEFRESLLRSDLCTADGMPIVWIARLLGVPIRERIAGADIFEELKSARSLSRRLSVYLFGGANDAAEAAGRKLNEESSAIVCAGSYYPGFGTVDEMSTDVVLNTVNASNADILAAALGAKKGQAWLLSVHDRLGIPVRVHLGATINFQAGTVKRAPLRMRRWGLEWLWRIKEEPRLWKRYRDDGAILLQLMLTRVLPLIFLANWYRLRWSGEETDLVVDRAEGHKSVILSIRGVAAARSLGTAASCFQDAVRAAKHIVINFTDTRFVDARFLGLLLMLNKELKKQQLSLRFTGVSPGIARIFRLNGFEFLLRTEV